jgi:hypothetical protein
MKTKPALSESHLGFRPKWIGRVPPVCQLCGRALPTTFVDGATAHGWAFMDLACHATHGRGLGIGLGQRYERQDDGAWVRVDG